VKGRRMEAKGKKWRRVFHETPVSFNGRRKKRGKKKRQSGKANSTDPLSPLTSSGGTEKTF